MIKRLIKKISEVISVGMGHRSFAMCLRCAQRGNPEAQLNAAEMFFNQYKDLVEAYAWASVASHNNPDAETVKKKIFQTLKSEQIQEALNLAKDYKKRFLKKF